MSRIHNTFGLREVTTRKRVMYYNRKGELVAEAGVKNEKDFDYNALSKIALHYYAEPIGDLI